MPTDNLMFSKEVVNGGLLRAAPTSSRFDLTLIEPHIEFAEERHVIPLIGKDMFDDMREERNASPSNYNADLGDIVQAFPTNANYEALWKNESFMMFNANCILYEAAPHIAIKLTPQGALMNITNTAENAGHQGVSYLRDMYMERIRFFSNKIFAYLCENSDTYSLFYNDDCVKNDGSDRVEPEDGFGLLVY